MGAWKGIGRAMETATEGGGNERGKEKAMKQQEEERQDEWTEE